MFELLASYKDLQQTISWTQTSAKSTSGGPYGCMATYSNWNCVNSPAPSEYGTYAADARKDSTEPPHGDWVHWEHDSCNLDLQNGVCR